MPQPNMRPNIQPTIPPSVFGKALALRLRRKPFWLWLREFLLREDRKHREALRFDALDNAARRDMGLPPKIEQARLPRGLW